MPTTPANGHVCDRLAHQRGIMLVYVALYFIDFQRTRAYHSILRYTTTQKGQKKIQLTKATPLNFLHFQSKIKQHNIIVPAVQR